MISPQSCVIIFSAVISDNDAVLLGSNRPAQLLQMVLKALNNLLVCISVYVIFIVIIRFGVCSLNVGYGNYG